MLVLELLEPALGSVLVPVLVLVLVLAVPLQHCAASELGLGVVDQVVGGG